MPLVRRYRQSYNTIKMMRGREQTGVAIDIPNLQSVVGRSGHYPSAVEGHYSDNRARVSTQNPGDAVSFKVPHANGIVGGRGYHTLPVWGHGYIQDAGRMPLVCVDRTIIFQAPKLDSLVPRTRHDPP